MFCVGLAPPEQLKNSKATAARHKFNGTQINAIDNATAIKISLCSLLSISLSLSREKAT